jgi:hypothetical protein
MPTAPTWADALNTLNKTDCGRLVSIDSGLNLTISSTMVVASHIFGCDARARLHMYCRSVDSHQHTPQV